MARPALFFLGAPQIGLFALRTSITVPAEIAADWYRICKLGETNILITIDVVFNSSSYYTGSAIISLSYARYGDKTAAGTVLSKANANSTYKILVDSIGLDDDNYLCIHKRNNTQNLIIINIISLIKPTDIEIVSTTQPSRYTLSLD